MWMRRIGFGVLAALAAELGGGCKKSPPPAEPLLKPPVEMVARVHWVGRQTLAAETNAAFVMGIWNLPESKVLETQTLDRLAAGLLGQGPGASNRLAATVDRSSVISNQLSVAGSQPPATNHSSPATHSLSPTTNSPSVLTGSAALLRPLLDDLLQRESFLNVRQATNLPGELTLAIKLSEERAQLWHTNLAALLESLTASRIAPVPGRSGGWQLQATGHQPPVTRVFDLGRAGEWTVVGLAPGHNELFDQMLGMIEDEALRQREAPTNLWLFANIDMRRVASALSLNWDLPADLPRVTLGINGDHEQVHTRAQLNFPKPLPFELEPWNIATNLINEPLVSFTAVQGLRPWVSSSKLWQKLELGTPPNQACLWAQNGPEFLSYLAAPLPDASNLVERATVRLLQGPNTRLAAEGMGQFQRATNGPGVIWDKVIFMTPYLRPVKLSGGDFLYGGLVASPFTNRPPAAELLQTILSTTNLVAYDWELTGVRIDQWLHFGQLLRFALHLAQIPPKSASFAWLKALESRLGNCVTMVTRTGPAQLSVARHSSLSVTAAELNWLADWLESPQFPRGLNTFLGEKTAMPRPKPTRATGGSSTNSAPAAGH
jgi:hypothetical protein